MREVGRKSLWAEKSLWKIARAVFAIAVVLAVTHYIASNFERIENLVRFSFLHLVLLSLLCLAAIVLRGIINYRFYNYLGADLRLVESAGLAALNTLGNLLPFSAGLLAKGAYLRKRHGISISRYLPATAALFVCFICANGVVGLVSITAEDLLEGVGIPAWLYVGFGIMVTAIAVLFVPLGRLRFGGRLRILLERVSDGWVALSKNPWLLVLLVSMQVGGIVIIAVRLQLLFQAMSQDVNLLHCLVMASASIMTRLMNISPGGLGVREGIVAGLSTIIGADFGVAVLAVGVDRLILVLFSGLTVWLVRYDVTSDRNLRSDA